MTPTRIAVFGVGHMGQHHARKIAERQQREGDVTLAGVADQSEERVRAVASELGVRGVSVPAELFQDVDAAIVAVPTVAHFDLCSASLAAGLDVLVEKPIAATIDQGERLVALAEQHRCVLQVAHQEWFNDAMRVARARITAPRFAEIHRMGPFTERATDVDVVRDLMIHDIEILQQLLGTEPVQVDAVGVPVLTDKVDIANARITFENACVANLTASRVSSPLRRFRLFQKDAYFSIDFLEKKAGLFRRMPSDAGGAPKIEFEELQTDPGDALLAQLSLFLEAVHKRETPAVGERGITGAEAVAALRTALRVIDAMPALEELS